MVVVGGWVRWGNLKAWVASCVTRRGHLGDAGGLSGSERESVQVYLREEGGWWGGDGGSAAPMCVAGTCRGGAGFEARKDRQGEGGRVRPGRTLASMTRALDIGPPCTTRWPTTAMSFRLEMGPCLGSVRSDTISTKAAPESLMRLAAVYWA